MLPRQFVAEEKKESFAPSRLLPFAVFACCLPAVPSLLCQVAAVNSQGRLELAGALLGSHVLNPSLRVGWENDIT